MPPYQAMLPVHCSTEPQYIQRNPSQVGKTLLDINIHIIPIPLWFQPGTRGPWFWQNGCTGVAGWVPARSTKSKSRGICPCPIESGVHVTIQLVLGWQTLPVKSGDRGATCGLICLIVQRYRNHGAIVSGTWVPYFIIDLVVDDR